jgi:P27 family predicted phage terminase small subunit
VGRRGPAPEPTALRVLKGTSHRPVNRREPKPPPGLGPCPERLKNDAIAREEWECVAPELDKMTGLVSKVDRTAFAAYCCAVSDFWTCRALLVEMGTTFKLDSGYVMQRPEVAQMNKARHDIKSFAAEFGLTPSSRSRVAIALPKESAAEQLERELGG